MKVISIVFILTILLAQLTPCAAMDKALVPANTADWGAKVAAGATAKANLETFLEWRKGIPDYEKRLYDRVKRINKRTVRIQVSIFIGLGFLLFINLVGIFYIVRRINGVISTRQSFPTPAAQSSDDNKPPRDQRAKFHLYGVSFLLFLALSGLLVFLTETLLEHYHGKMSPLAKISEETSKKSSMAYETPGQDHATYPQIAKMQYNYFTGYLPAPNIKGNGYKTNNAHFRYPEDLLPHKELGEIRVFVTGGSGAWGAGVNQLQLYTTIAENLFKKNYPSKNVRIISAGVGAYTSTQERIFIENNILDYEPDVIVMYSGWNDAYYTGMGKDIIEDGDHFLFQRYIYRHTNITPTERGKILYMQPEFPNFSSYRWKILWAIDTIIYNYYNYTYTSPSPISPNKLWSRVQRNVRIINALSREYGFSLIYYLQPNMLATRKPQGSSETTRPPLNKLPTINLDESVEPERYLSLMYYIFRDRMPQFAEREGFLYHDSDRALEHESQSVFIDSVHLGDRGQRLVGHDLFRILEQELRRRNQI